MSVDWNAVREWGIEVPALAISVLATVVVVVICLRYNRAIVADFRETIRTSQKDLLTHQREMREIASEDSRQLRDCLDSSNRIMGRACEILDRHEEIARNHEELIKEYRRQQSTGEKT